MKTNTNNKNKPGSDKGILLKGRTLKYRNKLTMLIMAVNLVALIAIQTHKTKTTKNPFLLSLPMLTNTVKIVIHSYF